jgi:ABC-type polysaccharide/polyol phosphate export permease
MLQEMPEGLKQYLLYSPIVQMVDLIRGLIVQDYIPHGTSVGYVLCCLLVATSVASITYMSLKEKVLISK